MKGKTSAVAIAAGTLVLVACGGGQATADGVQDDTRHVTAKTEQVRVADTRRECARMSNGVCKSWRTVTTGHHMETRTTRPERWCVELDNVNGDADRDDVWFTVSVGTYSDATNRDEGDRVTDMPYASEGC